MRGGEPNEEYHARHDNTLWGTMTERAGPNSTEFVQEQVTADDAYAGHLPVQQCTRA